MNKPMLPLTIQVPTGVAMSPGVIDLYRKCTEDGEELLLRDGTTWYTVLNGHMTGEIGAVEARSWLETNGYRTR